MGLVGLSWYGHSPPPPRKADTLCLHKAECGTHKRQLGCVSSRSVTHYACNQRRFEGACVPLINPESCDRCLSLPGPELYLIKTYPTARPTCRKSEPHPCLSPTFIRPHHSALYCHLYKYNEILACVHRCRHQQHIMTKINK